ncbi:MAG: hypothetical protein AAGI11_11095 [Pseudomonadota bacterium]
MIYIWVRRTVDWNDSEAVSAQLPSDLVEPVAVWNDCFSVPFHQFRQRVCDIARINHAQVHGAVCCEWDAIPDGELVLPVDDDDWFSPDIGLRLLAAREEQSASLTWRSSFLEVPISVRHQIGRARRRLIPATPQRYVLTTNNYAMAKGADTYALLKKHSEADRYFKLKQGAGFERLDARLSIMNRTMGSRTALRQKRAPFLKQKLLLSYYRYRWLYTRNLSAELKWAQPYQNMMNELLQALVGRSGRRSAKRCHPRGRGARNNK